MKITEGPGGGPGSPEFADWLANQKDKKAKALKAEEGLKEWEKAQSGANNPEGRVYEEDVPAHLRVIPKAKPRQGYTAGHDVRED